MGTQRAIGASHAAVFRTVRHVILRDILVSNATRLTHHTGMDAQRALTPSETVHRAVRRLRRVRNATATIFSSTPMEVTSVHPVVTILTVRHAQAVYALHAGVDML